MNSLVESYLSTELIFRATDGMAWSAVAASTEGNVTRPGGLLGLLNLEVSSALIITAWNPLGMKCLIEHNRTLQNKLVSDLNELGLTQFPVLGQEPGGRWKEESLLIPNQLGLETLELVYLLADKYEQNAIFEITETTKKLLGVRMGDISGEVGYRLIPLGPQGTIRDV